MAAVLICAVGAGHAVATPKKAPESPVSGRINEIAAVNQDIVDLDQALAMRQENVNRAIVDFQNSLAQRRLATVAARGARTELDRAGQAVVEAQKAFDGFVRLAYQQGADFQSPACKGNGAPHTSYGWFRAAMPGATCHANWINAILREGQGQSTECIASSGWST
jgi:hypothetical protein